MSTFASGLPSWAKFLGVLLFSYASAQAGSITTFTSTSVDPGANSGHAAVNGTTSATDSVTFGASSTFNATATANANAGILKDSAAVTLTNYSAGSFVSTGDCTPSFITYCGPTGGSSNVRLPATATASVTDGFTLGGGTGTAYLVLTFDVDGTTSFTSGNTTIQNNGSDAQGNLEIYAGPLFGTLEGSFGFFGGTNVFTSNPIAVTFGSDQEITFESDSSVEINDPTATVSGMYSVTASADFADTITLASIGAYSDSGATNLLSGYTVTSDSGTTYQTVSSTPEPASLLLVAGGLAMLAGKRLLRRS